jgi:hypothetical protein
MVVSQTAKLSKPQTGKHRGRPYQNMKPWTAPAPKLHSEPEAVEAATVELAVVPAWAGSTATERADGLSAVATSPDATDGP